MPAPTDRPATPQGVLRLGPHEFGPGRRLVMAIVNRTPDSFYDQGATFGDKAALDRVEQALADGADLVDVGGVKAGPGDAVALYTDVDRGASSGGLTRRCGPDTAVTGPSSRGSASR